MDEQKIKDNIAGRESAQLTAELARMEAKTLSDGARVRFWQQLQFEVAKELPPAPPLPASERPMSDDEAKHYGSTVITFGKYKDKRLDDVPMDYLLWLAEEQDPFKMELRRYLKSPRIMRERESVEA